ncbi:MAG: tetratricopeptide repeat protein [Betaproteobacteria bacterium]|nr:tetratricopeptide repeat protein [Betaproteobacteria bacterium]
MSLLMDALKKAELAKRQGQGADADGFRAAEGSGGLSLEPMSDPTFSAPAMDLPAADKTPSAASLPPPLAAHLEELDARFLAEAAQAASARKPPPPLPMAEISSTQPAANFPPRTPAAPDLRRASPEQASPFAKAAAQNLFAAKQPEKPPARKAFAIAVGTITVLSVCAIGGYFWWQLQPKSSLLASRGPLPPPAPVVAPPPAVTPAPTPALPPSATTVAPTAGTQGSGRQPTPAVSGEDDETTVIPNRASPVRRADVRTSPPIESDSPVRVSKAPLTINPALLRGFDAFNRGDFALAQVEYERAQKSDPRNTDALHGLAAIALRQGRNDQADLLYRRIVEADPQDAVATAALINSRGQIDPNTAESRLKSLVAAQPELAAPHFSLGNLYARHGRWSEAQQAYFRAYSAEPDNPDILYNLAISLEHLRQNKLAAQYYGQAIAAAQGRPAGFDKVQAAARLQSLQP